MSTRFTKTLAATAAVLTLAAAAAPAQAKPKWGPALGFGLVAGTMIGAAAASNAYAAPIRCTYVEQYDHWGNYLGTQRVCQRVY